jgi:hypothetical protein
MNTNLGKWIISVLTLMLVGSMASAHSVSLAWTVSLDDVAASCTVAGSCQQTVYRAPGACSATSSFISLGVLTASQATYTDATVPGGTWCYAVSFTLNGVESAKDTITVSLLPAAPTGIAVTGKT